jgi:hypothetical protein
MMVMSACKSAMALVARKSTTRIELPPPRPIKASRDTRGERETHPRSPAHNIAAAPWIGASDVFVPVAAAAEIVAGVLGGGLLRLRLAGVTGIG